MNMDAKEAFFTATFGAVTGKPGEDGTVVARIDVNERSRGLELKGALLLGTRAQGPARGRISTDGKVAHVIMSAKRLRSLRQGQQLRFDWITVRGQMMANLTISLAQAKDPTGQGRC